jgi:glutathione synthase/RimK-type ligase-like ATP-grasp enzyme
MKHLRDDCCVLNAGDGSWAFEPLAERLSAALGIQISAEPRNFNYVLSIDGAVKEFHHTSFIPLTSIAIAADKRLIAATFSEHHVPAPRTLLFDTFGEVSTFTAAHHNSLWCLKFPTGCGGNGHRILKPNEAEPSRWPRPFIVQEFIPLEHPEVYRLFCADGELFGWVVRRFPTTSHSSPWVAHARGARYTSLGKAPASALAAARAALSATGLLNFFGGADLLQRPNGDWVVLEVGTDGIFNHVDRELEDPSLESELYQRVTGAFWKWADVRSKLCRPFRARGF